MNRKRGFTLVELLVVMAIIAILASIVMPNVPGMIERARMTKAVAEIGSIKVALTTLLADAERSKLSQLFDPARVGFAIGVPPGAQLTPTTFEAALDLYSRATYSLLRYGRGIRSADQEHAELLRQELIPKLGRAYLELDVDPWGQAYRIWPGPWTGGRVGDPIPFRRFAVESDDTIVRVREDNFVINVFEGQPGDFRPEDYFYDPQEMPSKIGFPSDRDRIAYFWSFGGNLESSQMLYAPASTDPRVSYGTDNGEYWGGGDDITSWDSAHSWGRFYN